MLVTSGEQSERTCQMLMLMGAESSAGKELKQYMLLKFQHVCTFLVSYQCGTKKLCSESTEEPPRGKKHLKKKQPGTVSVH